MTNWSIYANAISWWDSSIDSHLAIAEIFFLVTIVISYEKDEEIQMRN
jgi:hypothetical protein